MCGIAGIHRLSDQPIERLEDLTNALLIAIESRGRDATGMLAMLDTGKVQLQREVVPASTFVRRRQRLAPKARTVLLHTRFATVGSPDDVRNAHPQISAKMAAVHNGTIYNADRLFHRFRLPRRAQVDSEIIPALIERAGWEEAALAVDLFQGGAAFAAVHNEHPTELLLGRTQHYPLVWWRNDDLLVWASTSTALAASLKYVGITVEWDDVHDLDTWTLLRVNGSVEEERVRKPLPPAPRRPLRAAQPLAKVSAPAVSKRAKKAARKAARKPKPEAQIWAPTAEEREAWMDEAVTDMMAWLGLSYEDAYEEVYGSPPPDDSGGWEWDGDDIVWEGSANA